MRHPPRSPLAAAACGIALLLVSACESPTQAPTVDAAVQFARGGAGPSVDAAIPSEGEQGAVDLQVHISGSGFDNGSNAVWLRDGSPAPDVVTNTTTYVSSSELIADITIDAAALETLYDIEVTTKRGKKGVGVELFSVKKPGEVAPTWSVTATDLGTLGGDGWGFAEDVTSAADGGPNVVGYENGFAFHWTESGGMSALTSPAGAVDTRANAVDAGGWIVGFATDLYVSRALVWPSPASAAWVLPQGTARVAEATDLNSAGVVVGRTFDHAGDPDGPQTHAMLWTVDGIGSTTTRDLHDEVFRSLGLVYSQAWGVNERGQVVGSAYDGLRERAFLWDDGAVVWLDDHVPSDYLTFPHGINDADPVQVVGMSQPQPGTAGPSQSWIWTIHADGTVDVEELVGFDGELAVWATAMNDAGEAVGASRPPNSDGTRDRAVLWTFDPATGARVVVDLGLGSAEAIDEGTAGAGLIRVVGATQIESGKGKRRTQTHHAVMWEVRTST